LSERREMVGELIAFGLSERRACRSLSLSRAAYRYTPHPEDPTNALIREELKRLCLRHRRYGTPRMTKVLRRGGYTVNHKRVERLWREACPAAAGHAAERSLEL
jgi:putative transposase